MTSAKDVCVCTYICAYVCVFFVSIAVVTKHRAKLYIIFIERKEIISKYLFYFGLELMYTSL